MRLENARILLTGAAGGLGQELARQLCAAGAHVLLAGRDRSRLEALHASLPSNTSIVCADLTSTDGIAATARAAQEAGVNVLINNAGTSAFGLLENQHWSSIEQVLNTNLQAPIQLTHALLPWLRSQAQASIVNIGSTFGALPFPGFAAYSAAKAGLRGFSQALRRELADSLVSVIYLSPRAIDTPFNTAAASALNRALGSQSDSARDVARQVVAALAGNTVERQFGFPERLFTWINGFAPRLVDRALAGKLATVKQHAPQHAAQHPTL